MDDREAILNRLRDLCGEVPGVKSAYRNRLRVPDTAKPALVVYDADEVADEDTYGRGRSPATINLVSMTPEIYLVLGADHEDVGTEMNAIRAALYKRIVGDETLRDLCADEDIRYQGCISGLGIGRSMEGEMLLNFTFRYVLNPATL